MLLRIWIIRSSWAANEKYFRGAIVSWDSMVKIKVFQAKRFKSCWELALLKCDRCRDRCGSVDIEQVEDGKRSLESIEHWRSYINEPEKSGWAIGMEKMGGNQAMNVKVQKDELHKPDINAGSATYHVWKCMYEEPEL